MLEFISIFESQMASPTHSFDFYVKILKGNQNSFSYLSAYGVLGRVGGGGGEGEEREGECFTPSPCLNVLKIK